MQSEGPTAVRKSVKTAAGLRTLRLAEFVVAMLRRQATELYVLATGCSRPAGSTWRRPTSWAPWCSRTPVVAGGTPATPPGDSEGTGRGVLLVTSHMFRKTAATMLDEAGLTA